MDIAVVGGSGRTGSLVVEQALARGHRVRALARHPEAVSLRHDHLVTAPVDVLGQDSLLAALAGSDAVVSALGIGASRQPTVVYSTGIANVLKAMGSQSISRLAVISAAPVGPRTEQPFLQRHLLMPVLDRVFGSTYDDMRRMEDRLRASAVDWVALRPPRLVDKPATGRYRVDATGPPPKGRRITYADLATALLDALDNPDLYRRTAYVTN